MFSWCRQISYPVELSHPRVVTMSAVHTRNKPCNLIQLATYLNAFYKPELFSAIMSKKEGFIWPVLELGKSSLLKSKAWKCCKTGHLCVWLKYNCSYSPPCIRWVWHSRHFIQHEDLHTIDGCILYIRVFHSTKSDVLIYCENGPVLHACCLLYPLNTSKSFDLY